MVLEAIDGEGGAGGGRRRREERRRDLEKSSSVRNDCGEMMIKFHIIRFIGTTKSMEKLCLSHDYALVLGCLLNGLTISDKIC